MKSPLLLLLLLVLSLSAVSSCLAFSFLPMQSRLPSLNAMSAAKKSSTVLRVFDGSNDGGEPKTNTAILETILGELKAMKHSLAGVEHEQKATNVRLAGVEHEQKATNVRLAGVELKLEGLKNKQDILDDKTSKVVEFLLRKEYGIEHRCFKDPLDAIANGLGLYSVNAANTISKYLEENGTKALIFRIFSVEGGTLSVPDFAALGDLNDPAWLDKGRIYLDELQARERGKASSDSRKKRVLLQFESYLSSKGRGTQQNMGDLVALSMVMALVVKEAKIPSHVESIMKDDWAWVNVECDGFKPLNRIGELKIFEFKSGSGSANIAKRQLQKRALFFDFLLHILKSKGVYEGLDIRMNLVYGTMRDYKTKTDDSFVSQAEEDDLLNPVLWVSNARYLMEEM